MGIARHPDYRWRYIVACDKCGRTYILDLEESGEFHEVLDANGRENDADLWYVHFLLGRIGWKLQRFSCIPRVSPFQSSHPVGGIRQTMRHECPACVQGLPPPPPPECSVTFGAVDPKAKPDVVSEVVLAPEEAPLNAEARRRRALEQAAQRLFRSGGG